MKLKKFIENYGYTAVKLIVTHIAMSVFGLMLFLPTGGSPMLGGIFGVVSVIFYFFMINNDISKVGAEDAVKTRTVYLEDGTSVKKSAAHPLKGFIIGAVSAIPDYEQAPERGSRCAACFAYNLSRTAGKAAELGMNFTTTLTVSPHKNSKLIFSIGGVYPHFEAIDFKKNDGFLKSMRLSKELNLYRQNFCGCEFSLRDRS